MFHRLLMRATGRRATCQSSPAFPAAHREDFPRFNRLPSLRAASPCGTFQVTRSASAPATTGHRYAIVVLCKGPDVTRPSSDFQIHKRAVLKRPAESAHAGWVRSGDTVCGRRSRTGDVGGSRQGQPPAGNQQPESALIRAANNGFVPPARSDRSLEELWRAWLLVTNAARHYKGKGRVFERVLSCFGAE